MPDNNTYKKLPSTDNIDFNKQLEYLKNDELSRNKPVSGISAVEYFGSTAKDFGSSKYDDPNNTPWQDLRTGDYNYLRGERQSNLEKWGAGVSKALLKTGVRTLNGIISPLWGVGAAIYEATDANSTVGSTLSKIWDNDVNNLSVATEQAIDESIGLYSTKAAAQAKGFAKLAYVNTWANDVLDGISYSAAAVLSGAAYGKMLSAASKLVAAGKMDSVAEATKVLEGLKDAKDQIRYVTELESKASKIKNGLNNGILTYIGASTEASANALNDANEWERQMVEKLSTNPDGSKRELTDGELQYIKDLRISAGNASYAFNIPVIMFDNWITFGKSVMGNLPTEKSLRDMARHTTKDLASDAWVQAERNILKKSLDATYGARKILGKAIPEGIQEWEQYAVSKGTEDYYNKKYFNPESANFMDSMSKGVMDAMSNEGLENFLIGAISGGIFGNAATLKTEGTRGYKNPYSKEALQPVLEYLNGIKSKDAYKDAIAAAHRHANLSEEHDAAIAINDDFEANNKKSDMLINYMSRMINAGKVEDVRSELESYKNLNAEDFEKILGIKLTKDEFNNDKKAVTDFIEKRLNKIDKISKLSDSVENQFPDANKNSKERLLYAAWTLEDAKDRIDNLKKSITKEISVHNNIAGIALNYDKLSIADKEEFRNLLKDNPDVNPLMKQEIFRKLEDIDKLVERRENFTKEYALLSNAKYQSFLNHVDTINSTIGEETTKNFAETKEKLDTEESKPIEVLQAELDSKVNQALQSTDDREVMTIAKEISNSPTLGKLVDKQVIDAITEHYNNIKPTSVRLRQLTKKHDVATNTLSSLESQLKDLNEALEEDIFNLGLLKEDFILGKSKLTPEKFERTIAKLQKALDKQLALKYDIEQKITDTKAEINELEVEMLEDDLSIDEVKEDLTIKQEEFKRLEDALVSTNEKISTLQKFIRSITKIFKSLYPNYESALLKGRYEVVAANEEILDNKRALNELKKLRKDLELEKSLLASEINDLQSEIADYEKVFNASDIVKAFDVKTPIKEAEINDSDAYEVSEKPITEYDPKKRKDVAYALNSTAGNNMLRLANGSWSDTELTEDESQRRWFKFTSNIAINSKSKYTLLALSPSTVKSLYGDAVKVYDANTITLVLFEDGLPVQVEGNFIYTTLPLAIEGTEAEVLSTLKDKYTNKGELNDTQILQRNEALKDLRKAVLESKEGIHIKVTGKTPGIYIKDPNADKVKGSSRFKAPVIGRVVENENEIDTIDIMVATANDMSIGGRRIRNVNKGSIVINHNGNILQARVAKLNEIPGAVDKVLELIKDLKVANEAGNIDKATELYRTINKITLFGNYNNGSKFKLFFRKDGTLVMGDQGIIDLNSPELREFIANKYIRVSNELLTKNESFTDPITGEKWPTYKQYLMSTKNRTADSVPVGTSLIPKSVSEQQYYNVGLTYNLHNTKVIESEPVALNKETSNQDALVGKLMEGVLSNSITKEEGLDLLSKINKDNDLYNMLESRVNDLGSNILSTPEFEAADISESELTSNTEITTSGLTEKDIEEYRNKLKDSNDTSNPNDFFKEAVNGMKATPEQLKLEQEWFEKTFPGIPYNRVKGIIDNRAIGKFIASGRVLISDMAVPGTTYHEAWHVVSQLFLTEGELTKLYNEYRNKVGNSSLTNKEVEEAMADEFMGYMMGERSMFTPVQKTFFQQILDFIKKLLGIVDNGNISKVFENIKQGRYNKVVSKSKADFYKSNLPNKDSAFTKDVMETMTAYFFKHLFKADAEYNIDQIFDAKDIANLNSLYNRIFKDFQDNFRLISKVDKGIADKLIADYAYIDNNRESIKREFEKYVTRFGIEIKTKIRKEEDSQEDEINKETKDSTYIDGIQFNTKDGAPKAIKMLIASLPEYTLDNNGKAKLEYNNLLAPKIVNYNKTMDFLHNYLAGAQSYKEMINKLELIASTKPSINVLLKYLSTSSEDPTPTGTTDDKFRLQRQFFQQFAKTKNTYLMTYMDKEGNIYSFDSNSSKHADKIRSKWNESQKAFYNDPNSMYSLVGESIILDRGRMNTFYNKLGDTFDNSYIDFLSKLGITFSTNKFTENEQSKIVAAVTDIYNYIIKNPNITELFHKEGSNKALNDLITIEIGYNKDVVELSHMNPEKKTVYGITLNTFLSLIANNVVEHINTIDSLPSTQGSVWKNFIKNNPDKFKLIVAEGLKPADGEGEITSKLSATDLLVIHFNSILANKFPYLRAGDKKLEYMFELNGFKLPVDENGEIVNIGDAKQNEVGFYDILLGYYKDELTKIDNLSKGIGADIQYYKDNAKTSQIFEDIDKNNQVLGKFKPGTDIDKFIASNKKTLFKMFDNYFNNEYVNDIHNNLVRYGLVTETFETNKNGYTGKMYNVASFVNKNTLKALFDNNNGILTEKQYFRLLSEVSKKQFISGVEQTKLFIGDMAYYKLGGDLSKRTGGAVGPKKITDTDPATNEWLRVNKPRTDGKTPDGKINTWVFDDVISSSQYLNEYYDAIGNKADAYSKMNEADAQGYITLDEYREFLLRSGEWTPQHDRAYNKISKGQIPNADEFQLFMPLKPQYFGPQIYDNLYVPTYYKLSLIPLIPSLVKGRTIEDLATAMQANKVGIAMYESANKVGRRLSNNSTFYNNKGGFNTDATTPIQQIDYKYLGIQVDIAPIEKNKVTVGTQMRKLILSNLFTAGKPKSLTTSKGVKSGESILNSYNKIINDLTKLKREKLLKRLSITENADGSFSIGDLNTLRDILLSEAESKDVAYNVLDSIELALKDDVRLLDATPAKNKLEQLLYSLVQNKVISQKVFGDMKVQASSAGFELKAKGLRDMSEETVKGITWLGNSKTLGFYTQKDSETTKRMQVLLPYWFRDTIADYSVDNMDNKDLLQLIGFRIPTQGMNSIDAIEVVGFLPREAGNIVIVPSEIVAKSGSDFDVDKLSIYMPNYITTGLPNNNRATNIYKVPTTEKELRNLYEDIKAQHASLDIKFTLTYEEFFEKNKEKMLENEMIELMSDVILAKENFKQLITPNSVDMLTGAVSQIRQLKGISVKGKSGTSMIHLIDNIKTAISFWSGKGGVGIAALHNTHHVLSQIADLKLSNGNFINMPHNTDVNGAISLAGEFDINNTNSISEVISEFINAYVDVAKDPFIFDLNAGTQTANTWLYLIRAGVPLDYVARFMTQPIIWDYVTAQSINESSFNKIREAEKSKKELLTDIAKKYPGKLIIDDGGIDITGKYLTIEELDAMLKPNGKNSVEDFNDKQRKILKEFLHYQETAKQLGDLQNAMSSDTNGAGKSRITARLNAEKINKHLDPVTSSFNIDAVKKMLYNSPLTEFHNTVQKAGKYFNDLFITDTPHIKDYLNTIVSLFKESQTVTYEGERLVEVYELIENEFINYALQNTEFNNKKLNNKIEDLFYGKNSLANKIAIIKKNNKTIANNKFISELFPIINSDRSNKRTATDNIKFYFKKMNTYELNTLTDAYTELYDLESGLAEDITELAILQSGIGNSPINFLSSVPASKFYDIAVNTLLKYKTNKELNTTEFGDMFFENMVSNKLIVPRIKAKSRNILSKSETELVLKNGTYASDMPYIAITEKDPTLTKDQFEQTLMEGGSPFKTTLYKKILDTEEVVHYEVVEPRGNGYRLKDYRTKDTKNIVKVKTTVVNTTLQQTSSTTSISKEKDVSLTGNHKTMLMVVLLKSKLSDKIKNDILSKLSTANKISDFGDLAKYITITDAGLVTIQTPKNCQ